MYLEIISIPLAAAAPQEIVSPAISPEMQLIQSKGLGTPQGRERFLEEELTPFILYVDALNREIQTFSNEVSLMDAESAESKETMLSATNAVLEKMAELNALLPVLENTLLLEVDFEALDSILAKSARLDAQEEAVLKRVSDLCQALDHWSH